jgi:hypothetical protein
MTVTLQALDAGTLDPKAFRHRDHIVLAFEALRQEEFFAASARIARGLRGLAAKAGAPEKFNATITHAYLSLIAERMREGETLDAFLAANPDLLDKARLRGLYSAERLADPRARQVALMPDIAAE